MFFIINVPPTTQAHIIYSTYIYIYIYREREREREVRKERERKSEREEKEREKEDVCVSFFSNPCVLAAHVVVCMGLQANMPS